MAYVLEKINAEDQEKIIKDAECDPKKRNSLSYARDHREFSENWAVDRERNCYLFSAPITTREEAWDRPYYVFFKGVMYRVNNEGATGNRVYFDEKSLPLPPLLTELQEEIRAGFAVYGRWGNGPLNEFGKPEFAVYPEFKAGS